MKLQIALDDIELEEALSLLELVSDYIDIIEVGTPMMMRYGMHAVKSIREQYPDKEILCDAKIMDAGYLEASLVFESGADYVTVLSVTDDLTIEDVVSAANNCNKKVVVDLITETDFEKRVPELEKLGVDIISVHTGVDRQAMGVTPLLDLKEVTKYNVNSKVSVAGGINLESISDYLKYRPDIIIVGGGITKEENPLQTAKAIKQIMGVGNCG